VRTKKDIQLFTVPERNDDTNTSKNHSNAKITLLDGPTSFMKLSPDGSFAYVLLQGAGVVRCDLLSTDQQQPQAFLQDTQNVQMLDISPLGTYLLTWERWYAEKPNNLKLWESATGMLVASFSQKALKREAWPYLQFSHDEQYAFLLCTNEVRVYPTQQAFMGTPDTVRYSDKLRIPGITSHSVPRTAANAYSPNYLLTSFCPGSKDKPARGSLHVYNPKDSQTNPGQNFPAKVSKSLFQAEEMKVHWSPVGDVALITLQTSVDTSGQSYYGSSQLFILSSTKDTVDAVPLHDKHSSPILAVSWLPNSDKPPCFCVVAGKMPAMSSLHHGQTGAPLFWFGNAHRNTISWAPHGRFLALAGFGNLQGGIGFWDRNKMKLIPSASGVNAAGLLRVEAVVGYEWSPDSRLFLTSTTAPRMNVDNGMRLFRYNGDEIQPDFLPWDNESFKPDKLLEARFVPAPLDKYPDRPQSPVPERADQPSAAPVAVAKSVAAAPSKPAGRYVPPSARNRAGGGGTSLAERMRREREGNLQGAAKVDTKKPQQVRTQMGRVIPGMAVESNSTKSKSALKREKAKLKKQQQEAEASSEKSETASNSGASEQPQQLDPEKRARKLKKTLKQIDDLKQKDPTSLNDDQKSKIASEESLRAELESLGIN